MCTDPCLLAELLEVCCFFFIFVVLIYFVFLVLVVMDVISPSSSLCENTDFRHILGSVLSSVYDPSFHSLETSEDDLFF